ncbi:MAG: type I methionyl aminopeptidase [Myxococcaceae bacterium]|nr:type I methionyl aminopeptidase [Myxococcaceae bacterium]MBH2006550.1 type I methionyl aminopeptidase [Myxococcaceae bacterium]
MNHRPISLLSPSEIDKMRRVGRLAAELLEHLGSRVAPGISTQDLNDEAEQWTRSRGAISAPLGYGSRSNPFPRSICTSVNDVVCHGIPNPKQILKSGDIINIDVTPILNGFHGDTSKTFLVGDVHPEVKQLVQVTEECLKRGIAEVAPGKRFGDIGAAIQEYAESFDYGVVREFVGHGIGRDFHGDPQVFHFGTRGKGLRMLAGMCFTIEPMINLGHWKTKMLKDGWTAVTEDGSWSAQFEHTLLVTSNGFEILTQAP